jgi:hypothetical protein
VAEPQGPSPNNPSPTPSPSKPAGDSSPASEKASHSDRVPAFIGDAGPEFNSEEATPPPQAVREEIPQLLPEWEEDTVRALLTLKGRAIHAGIGVAEQDWRYTELDLAAIAPPLTRIANRYEPVARLAKHADPLILLFAFGGYGVRSLEERAAIITQLAEESDVSEIEGLSPDEAEGLARQEAPMPSTAHRTVTPYPTSVQPATPAAPMQEPPPAAAPPRPGEANVEPAAINWEVPRQ